MAVAFRPYAHSRFPAQYVGETADRFVMVRGRDHGTFDLETEPEGELHPAALKRYAGILRASNRIMSKEQRTPIPLEEVR